MISERVRHARTFCGLTQTELSQLSGLSQGQISDIEGSRTRAKDADIERIARATGFPVGFFHLGPLPDMADGYFRRLKRGKSKVTAQVRAQARQLIEVVQSAEPLVAMPPVRLKPVAEATDIETIASDVRDEAGVGSRDPIPNLTRAIERAGVVVAAVPSEIPDHYGFSAWPNFLMPGGRPIIVFSRDDPGDRQRFTIGHELGHLLLHSRLRIGELDADHAEREANAFAGALLLPREAAMEAMRAPLTLTTLAHVKATFGVSIGMCAYRANQLGLISDERHAALRKQLTSRGWHRHEPVEVPQEQPLLIRRILELVGSGESDSARASSVSLPPFAYRALVASN